MTHYDQPYELFVSCVLPTKLMELRLTIVSNLHNFPPLQCTRGDRWGLRLQRSDRHYGVYCSKWRNVHSGKNALPNAQSQTDRAKRTCSCIADQYDSFLKNPDTYFASCSRLVKCLCPVANRKGRITCNPGSGAAKPLRLWTLDLQLSAQQASQAGGGQSLQPLRDPELDPSRQK